MIFPGKQWESASPESQGVRSDRLEAALAWFADHIGKDGVRRMAVIRHGRCIWRGPDADGRQGVWSATKSFTSTVLGLLVDDGRCTVDTLAAEHVPALATHYGGVTLRHFTTMTSGYRALGDEPAGTYIHGPSKTPFEPNPEPLFAPPGSQFAYWDSAMNMFGLALTQIAGEPLRELFLRRVGRSIGLTDDAWQWGCLTGPDGSPVQCGSGNHAGHVQISALDLARLGHLFLCNGSWEGRELLSAEWVREATSLHVPADLPAAQSECDIDGRGCYGYNWWVNADGPGARPQWPSAPRGTFAASGFNNNKCFVIPAWQTVVTRLGLDGRASADVWDGLLQRLSLALEPEK